MRLGWLVALGALCGCEQLFDVAGQPKDVDAGSDAGPLPREWQQVTAGNGMTCAIAMDQGLWCWGYSAQGETGTTMDTEVDQPTRVGTSTWLEISADYQSVCGIQTDNSLWCWGDGSHANLGIGNTSNETHPSQVDGSWLQVAAGTEHTCAINSEHLLYCWGYNGYNELGDGTTNTVASPEPIGTATWTAVSAAPYHTCAIAQADNTLWCWGTGDLGVMDLTTVATPMQVTTDDTFSAVSTGLQITCAITTTSQLRCWGYAFNGAGPMAVLIDGADLTDWTSVSSTWTHVCATRSDGSLWCFGDDSTAQLGFELTSGQAMVTDPTQVIGGDNPWISVATGNQHTCAIDTQHALWCMGSDGLGELGDGGTSRHTPTAIPGTWANASAGTQGTCAVDMAGNLACTGVGTNGQIGDGNTINRKSMVSLGPGWLTVSTGREDRCALASDGTMACWGANTYTEIAADGTELDVPTPIAIPDGLGNTTIAIASGNQSCAIENDTSLFCWGDNAAGEIGIGDTTDQLVDTPSFVFANASAVTAGEGFTCAIAQGATYCFGYGAYGELGDNMAASSSIPVSLVGTYVGITAGLDHACAWDAIGNAYCWGEGVAGDLGLGNPAQFDSPQQLSKSWRQLAAGDYFTCGIALDSTLWCWGSNDTGQLGDGTTLDRYLPVQVGTASNWQSVTTGNQHACALDSTNTLYCWGLNDQGQLGDGTGFTATLSQVH